MEQNEQFWQKQIDGFVSVLKDLDAPGHWTAGDYICIEGHPERCSRLVSPSCPDKKHCDEHVQEHLNQIIDNIHTEVLKLHRFMEAKR